MADPRPDRPDGSDERARRLQRRLRGVAGSIQHGRDPEADRLVYERVRLGILSALSVSRRLSFTELRDLLDTTDGNLSAHARKLEDAGYIECRKRFEGRTPRTDYRLAPAGRTALERYLDHMERLIRATRG